MTSLPPRLLTRSIAAWALLDLAATVWSFAIATRFLSDWIVDERGEADWKLGMAGMIASILLVGTLPYWGELSDARPIRVRLLGVFIAVCCAATFVLGFVSWLPLVLALVVLATYCFQAALAQYDPLLKVVAPTGREGVVSGIGVGVGYFGVLLALPLLSWVVGSGSSQRAIPVAAVLFAVLSIPCLLVVRSPAATRTVVPRWRYTVATTWREVTAAKHERWGRFLVARFLYADAIATIIAVMTIFAQRVGGLTDGQVNMLLGVSIVLAVLGAFATGMACKRYGPKPVLMVAVALGAVMMVLAAVGGGTWLIWLCGPLCGMVLAAVNTADRALMLALVGDHPTGGPFGVYALVGKISSGVGPLVVWGGTIAALSGTLGKPGASQLAVGLLAVVSLAGLWVLRRVPDAGRPVV